MSDHPQFSKLKKVTVSQLKPAVKEGYLVKKGADYHTWKKRWFVMKDQYIFYFQKNSGNEKPKGVIELDGNSSAELVLDLKRPTIVINSVYREQEINSDSVEEAKSWVDAINEHAKTLGKPAGSAPVAPQAGPQTAAQEIAPQVQPQADNVQMSPNAVQTWDQVKSSIDAENGNWDAAKIKDFMVKLGKATCDQYLYSIMQSILSDWKDDAIAQFWWEDFCDGDLEDLETVVAGLQGDSTIAMGPNGEKLGANETVFVLGRDERGAVRLANIYHWVTKKEDFNWSEVTRCVLSAIANWKLNTKEEFFQEFVYQIIKGWSASEIAAFISYVASYAKKNEDEAWENWPVHAVTFFKKLVVEWDDEKKKSFMNIVNVMWDWPKESLAKLTGILNGSE